ncbi:XRE family transcriptional regulator [Paenibacillus pasadenensis]|uniref:helix-turn-helix domain-containing protein n=1 Tax=Paenibacillus pasadenensis TaxID=217090 RepID=UPI00203D5B62|nr:XRE family transcriptional regulator [Paenibacillus pasadenensis]MCM3750336.1 XRE family transcriptional regulator [Paenibacillus pasadenensis]
MDTMVLRVARNLKRIRKSRGHSLDKLSELTGVSKTMLAQIERADSNPTITVLWKIASGLRVSVTDLIEEDRTTVTLVRAADVIPITSGDGRYLSYPLFPYTDESRSEIYRVLMQPGCQYEAEPHHEGVEEYVTVTRGTLRLRIGAEWYTVSEGDALRFSADQTHAYYNESDTETELQSVIRYPF